MRVDIQTLGCPSASVTVDPGERVLVGREPDEAALGTAPDTSLKTQSVIMASPSVSANHVLVFGDGATLSVADLGSRNGTWLRLPPRLNVVLPRPEAVSLYLALPPVSSAPDDLADSTWSGHADYAQVVCEQIEQWLRRRDLPARVAPVRRGEDDSVGPFSRLPLANGVDLAVTPLRTMETTWLSALASIERYVARQNMLFEAHEALRDAGLIVVSEKMRKTVARVVDVAAAGARNLLLIGPSGAGKEGLARCFHQHTGRPGAFVAKNCAMFSGEFARTEIFGAEKGAFTGAVQRIVGAVETAHEGTLFLDELGELPPALQPILLRFLDRGEFERLGHRGPPCTSDVRIVAATNKDVRAAAAKGEFRTDLWFRLSVHVIEVPPLAERFEDVVAYLASRDLRADLSLYEAFSSDAVELLRNHSWEGNFRELINFADRVASRASHGQIDADACRRALEEGALQPSLSRPPRHPTIIADHSPARWGKLAEAAATAFAEDHHAAAPRTWDDVKLYLEAYLKPMLLVHLGGIDGAKTRADVDVRAAVERLCADRGTVAKQIDRYFDRFVR
jgi:DNA-binding NtrC family response regulator